MANTSNKIREPTLALVNRKLKWMATFSLQPVSVVLVEHRATTWLHKVYEVFHINTVAE